MDTLFETSNAATPEAMAQAPKIDDAKKDKIHQLKVELQKTLASDPSFAQRVKTLSKSLEVVNSLGFGENGNIVLDHSSTEKKLLATSAIVGYRVRNIGNTDIQYKTAVCTKDANGTFVAEPQDAVLKPGATADLTRQYMTMLCAIPEISFELANGRVLVGSGSKTEKGVKGQLESYYFSFNKDEGKTINDDTVKLAVAAKVDGRWVVKPEYEATFGLLNNPKTVSKARAAKETKKYDASVAAANYVMRVIMQQQ